MKIFQDYSSNEGVELSQHKPATAAKRPINVSIFGINKDFNEKLSFVLCYIQSCVHIYGHIIQRNVCKNIAKV